MIFAIGVNTFKLNTVGGFRLIDTDTMKIWDMGHRTMYEYISRNKIKVENLGIVERHGMKIVGEVGDRLLNYPMVEHRIGREISMIPKGSRGLKIIGRNKENKFICTNINGIIYSIGLSDLNNIIYNKGAVE